MCVCDSRGAWLSWHQTGLGGGRGAACLHAAATVCVCFKGKEVLSDTRPFVTLYIRLPHYGDIQYSGNNLRPVNTDCGWPQRRVKGFSVSTNFTARREKALGFLAPKPQ